MSKILLTCCLLLNFYSLYAQRLIEGKVISATGKNAIGNATIMIPGQTTLITDKDGRFFINASGRKISLKVSCIGYKEVVTEISLPLNDDLIIELEEDITALSEVTVSTGYQTLPRERATGSFVRIDTRAFNQQTGTDILGRLEAVAGSVMADRSTSGSNGRLMVRGLSSIRGPKDVLVIVDNFPYEGDINNINPNDVEDITVLKDAAASSIWGARAGNGVIVITTKKGKFNNPLLIDFNSNLTIGNKPDLSYIPQISSSDFIDVERMLYENGFYESDINSPNMPALSPVVEILLKKDNSDILDTEAEAQINTLRDQDIRGQFNKYLYQKSVNQQYALGLNGGNENMAWVASAGYDRNTSTLDEHYRRYNLRFQNTYKPTKGLQLTSGIYYTQSKSASGRPGYGSVTTSSNKFLPYVQFADENGAPVPMLKDYRMQYIRQAGNGKLLDWLYYPLEDYKHTKVSNDINDMIINAGAASRITDDIRIDVKYQYERQHTAGGNLSDEESYFARNMVNRFTQINALGQPVYKIPPGGILNLSNTIMQSNNLRGQINFDRKWGRNEVAAIGGAELRRMSANSSQSRYYGYDGGILSTGLVDYTTSYPNFITGAYAFIPNNDYLGRRKTNFLSAFANASYTYDSKYIFSLSGRRDASNLFGLKVNDQWNPFWSAGLGWVISREDFYGATLLPYLKLRATYGFSGNIDPSMVAVNTITYSPTLAYYSQNIFASFSNYYNPELKWEKLNMLNIGIDFKGKGDRITGSIEFFRKNGSNLFGESLLDYTSGVGPAIVKNVADMSGNGLDLELSTMNIKSPISWTSTVNFSYYKDKVTRYYMANKQGSDFVSLYNNVVISGIEDQPVYGIYAYRWAGLDPQTGDPRGYLQGEISKDYTAVTGSGTQVEDLRFFGSALPVTFGSFINTLTFRQLSLNFSMIYKLGYYFRRSSINYSELFNNWKGHSDFAFRWTMPGDEQTTNVPSLVYPASTAREIFYAGSEVLVKRGDHLRLQYVNLSYDLPKKLIGKGPVKSLEAYLNVNNVGILWRENKHGIDPDYDGQYAVPAPRTYAIGIRGRF